ncbi:MAG: phosphatidylserine decarboxylase [Sphingomonadales bacterium]|nr:phosphatidylserine decarboxylase [Sphingomonadales bacterium]
MAFKLQFVPALHPEGRPFIAISAVATLVFFLLWQPLGWLGVLLTAWCAYFFRDPERFPPQGEGVLVSPADGVVLSVGTAPLPPELEGMSGERVRISIFMNVFNVHVNRVPEAGEITDVKYIPGAFINASLDKASEDNERNLIRMTTAAGDDLVFVQIAGLVARRIVCTAEAGDAVGRGERVGIIRFGSRVDVYLPTSFESAVREGQTMIAGETVVARRA